MPRPLEARLHHLENCEAVRALIARYGPLADAGESIAVAELWCEDGEYDVGGYGVARGRPAIAALIDSPHHRALMAQGCTHILSPPAITIDGDRAVAINHSVVLRREGEGYEVWRVSANRRELLRTPAGWRVKRRINRPLDSSGEALGVLALR